MLITSYARAAIKYENDVRIIPEIVYSTTDFILIAFTPDEVTLILKIWIRRFKIYTTNRMFLTKINVLRIPASLPIIAAFLSSVASCPVLRSKKISSKIKITGNRIPKESTLCFLINETIKFIIAQVTKISSIPISLE